MNQMIVWRVIWINAKLGGSNMDFFPFFSPFGDDKDKRGGEQLSKMRYMHAIG